MENKLFCQSCGMPMEEESHFGTNKDNTKNEDYCAYCYKDGEFPAPEMTMEEMIAFNLKYNEENDYPMGPQDEAKKMMEAWFPTLKRWQAQ